MAHPRFRIHQFRRPAPPLVVLAVEERQRFLLVTLKAGGRALVVFIAISVSIRLLRIVGRSRAARQDKQAAQQ